MAINLNSILSSIKATFAIALSMDSFHHQLKINNHYIRVCVFSSNPKKIYYSPRIGEIEVSKMHIFSYL